MTLLRNLAAAVLATAAEGLTRLAVRLRTSTPVHRPVEDRTLAELDELAARRTEAPDLNLGGPRNKAQWEDLW